MNLSPDWREILRTEGWEAIHWSDSARGREYFRYLPAINDLAHT
jgi:hypothetical protein